MVRLLSLALLLALVGACKRSNADRAAVPVDGHLRVEAGEDGFSPSAVAVQKGQKLSLDFVRTTETTCATEVVFPELNLEKKLPLNEVVTLEIPTGEARTLSFQCGMGMYKSQVVVR